MRSAGFDDQPDDRPEAAVAVARNALKKREKAHAFALCPPGAAGRGPVVRARAPDAGRDARVG
ncbi:hypothetical protein ACF073_33505 [Streptomyces sp. NPDC015171]|uniref:hypothetical protein n=1 Tax=Streptomyces sp. NPDC015171 TaxID=3364945 RepID=UPI0036FEFED8